jgi:predicted enzyme related to lactoylglutathione lyase
MKLGYTIPYFESVAETIAFYEQAFGLSRGMVTDTNQYGELKSGDTKLAFAAHSFVKAITGTAFNAAAPGKSAPPMELGLDTDTVEEDFECAVAAGAVVVKRQRKSPGAARGLCSRQQWLPGRNLFADNRMTDAVWPLDPALLTSSWSRWKAPAP